MNHREPPPLSAGTRRALHCLSLILLPALATDGVQALPHPGQSESGRSRHAAPIPYLPVMGAPPLRFQEVLPPPDPVTRPVAAAPPVPALTPTESSVALANAAAARSATIVEASDAVPVKTETVSAASKPVAPAKLPPAILPDSIRPTVRPEDFLPYFQVPGMPQASGDIMPSAPKSVPEPARLPPSAATYRQSPK